MRFVSCLVTDLRELMREELDFAVAATYLRRENLKNGDILRNTNCANKRFHSFRYNFFKISSYRTRENVFSFSITSAEKKSTINTHSSSSQRMAPPKRGKEEKKSEEVTEEVGVFIFPDGSRYDGQYIKKVVAVESDDAATAAPGGKKESTGGNNINSNTNNNSSGDANKGRRSATPTGFSSSQQHQLQLLAQGSDASSDVAAALQPVVTTSANGTTTSVVIYRHGNGVYVDGPTTYDGQWDHDRMHGFGKLTTNNGATYIGYFANNEFAGRGVHRWPDGSKYDGQWRGSVMHGEGCYWDVTGKKWKGRFLNGVGNKLAEVEENVNVPVALGA